MPNRSWISTRAGVALVCVVGLASILQACGDDSSSSNDDDPGEPHTVSFPLEGALQDVFLQAEQTTNVTMTLRPPVDMGPIASAEIDVSATMENMTITPMMSKRNAAALGSLLSGAQTGTMLVRVGADPETVCQDGIIYGPYEVAEQPETIELNEATVSVINTGSATVCLQIYSSFDAFLSVSELVGTVTEEECDSPANFAGSWTGTYACGNSCGEGFDGDIVITFTQNGRSGTYIDDGGDEYEGTICGNVFTFERFEENEIERGTLTLDDANHATKRSTWRLQVSPFCTGDCVDQLTRQP